MISNNNFKILACFLTLQGRAYHEEILGLGKFEYFFSLDNSVMKLSSLEKYYCEVYGDV